MHTDILSLFGYFASLIIAISMTMSSIVKFRWFNLAGALGFATYGLLIHAIPVTFLNGFIAAVDIFYLLRIYNKEELFETLQVRGDNKYLQEFIRFHQMEINKFFPGFEYKAEMNTISFFILRNMKVAGVFLAHREDGDVLTVGLDYVIPEYRDYKNGKFIYQRLRADFIKDGYKSVLAPASNSKYAGYLKKLGFIKDNQGHFVKELLSK